MLLARPFTRDKYEWHQGSPWFWQRGIRSVTGENLGHWTMRRLVGGKWQYRNMTDEEATAHQALVQGY